MQTYKLLTGFFVLFLLSFQVDGQVALARVQPGIEVKNSSFYLNGKAIKLPIAVADLEKIIGKADRSVVGARKVSTWDELGLIAYQKEGTDEYLEIGVILDTKENSFEFSPTKPFRGSFTIDGARVTAASSLNSINRQKKGAKFKPIPIVKVLSEYRSGAIYLVMWQTEKARVIADAKVLTISIAKEEKL